MVNINYCQQASAYHASSPYTVINKLGARRDAYKVVPHSIESTNI